jgi:hypothetical protein
VKLQFLPLNKSVIEISQEVYQEEQRVAPSYSSVPWEKVSGVMRFVSLVEKEEVAVRASGRQVRVPQRRLYFCYAIPLLSPGNIDMSRVIKSIENCLRSNQKKYYESWFIKPII